MQYYEGSGTYGHSCYDDVAQAAALLSQLAGKPVRLQFMRWDEHGWDNYGPAHVGEVRAGADATGKIVGVRVSRAGSMIGATWKRPSSWRWEARRGMAARSRGASESAMNCGGMYDIPNVRLVNHHVPGLGYLKGAWLRSPLDLSFSFASEQAIDQLAFLSEHGSVRVSAAQYQGCALAGGAGCRGEGREMDSAEGGFESVRSENRDRAGNRRGNASGVLWRGRRRNRSQSRKPARWLQSTCTGRSTRAWWSIPAIVESQISGQLVQTASRMFKEEVTFNTTNVTSLDWASYPDPALRGMPGGDAGGGAAVGRAIDRRGRRGDGGGRGRDRERILRRHRRADAGISVHAEARPGGSQARIIENREESECLG